MAYRPKVLEVANGGTGNSTLTGVVIGNGTSAFSASPILGISNGGTGLSTIGNSNLLATNSSGTLASRAFSINIQTFTCNGT